MQSTLRWQPRASKLDRPQPTAGRRPPNRRIAYIPYSNPSATVREQLISAAR